MLQSSSCSKKEDLLFLLKKKNTAGNYIQRVGGKCFSLKYVIYTISAVLWWTGRAGSDNLMNA